MRQEFSLKNCQVKGKKALIRVDFNVPLDKTGRITDDTRISASLPTIRYILDHGGSVILMSHLGRPKQKHTPEFSLKPCAERLSMLLQRPVLFAEDCIGKQAIEQAKNLQPGQVLLLENLRFYEAEENPSQDDSFAKKLANLGDLYINDAFGTAHRAHSSTVEIARFFPGKTAAGFLLENEVKFLGRVLKNPERPFLAIIGGAKVSSKLGVLKSLLEKVDVLLIGGAMAFTFLKAQGQAIGDSLFEEDQLKNASMLLQEAKAKNVRLLLPVDSMVFFERTQDIQAVDTSSGIPDGYKGVDIGIKTIKEFLGAILTAKTIFWNGPLGICEDPRFAKGTEAVAKAVANSSGVTIVGGGDSIAAVRAAGVAEKMTHLSTGGGASLEFIEQGTLPGIEALKESAKCS